MTICTDVTGERKAGSFGQRESGWLSRRLRSYSSVLLDALRLTLCSLVGVLSGLFAFFVYYFTSFAGDYGAIFEFFREPNDRYFHLSLMGGLIFANVTFVMYGRPVRRQRDSLLRQVFVGWGLSLLIILGILFMLKTGPNFSRGLVAVWALFGLPFFLGARLIERQLVGLLAHAGLAQRWVAIVGATPQAELLAGRLTEEGLTERLRVVGIFDEQNNQAIAAEPQSSVVGDLESLKELCRSELLDSVILALPGADPGRIRAVADEFRALPTDVLLGPDVAQLELRAQTASRLGPVPMVSLSKVPMRDWWGVAKWLEDIVISVTAFLFMAPLLLLISLAIKIESKGPIFFRQRRFGFNNQEFSVYKFRTMYHELRDDGGAEATKRYDRRVTSVGRLLRRTSLDELPQLLNVLRGEMSIVGPRAHPVNMRLGDQLIHDRIQDYAARHRVKPGITGLAQVNGNRGEVHSVEKAEQRVQFDLLYIESWSVWLDLEIVFRTLLKLPFDRSAY